MTGEERTRGEVGGWTDGICHRDSEDVGYEIEMSRQAHNGRADS